MTPFYIYETGKKTQFRTINHVYSTGDHIVVNEFKFIVTAVRTEPLQDISAADCVHEGVDPDWEAFDDLTQFSEEWEEPEEFIEECEDECDWINYGNRLVESTEHKTWFRDRVTLALRLAFRKEWAKTHGDESWDQNPIVQVLTFKKVDS